MANRFDVIVIGVGAMGSAACFHLARRGVRVLGIEQFEIAHDRGSSHGESRMIRSAYYEHENYVPLIRRAFELWRQLEKESSQKLMYVTGGLYIGLPQEEFIGGARRSAETHSIPHEMLDGDSLRQRFPQFHLPSDHVA